ncbi:DUF2258 domain-containing protein [Candidatus Bathyarchaeota archaeon]|nr:MAG: DUF2258 domain-containing protein [Candidatus Hecatellales archaeon]RLI34034.1 MAG: DUF2258 domain-containing protein [Candidatus Bathyarchaeota archaeon]
MPTLNTGLIISGGYADKVRKTLFAQMRSTISEGKVSSQEVARAVAELNQKLYGILVDKLKSERGDVVRIRIDYQVEDGKIAWVWGTLRIELFRRVPDEEVDRLVREALAEAGEKVEGFTLEKVATTSLGDSLYRVRIGGGEAGMLLASKVGEEAVVKGAALQPKPAIIEGFRLELQGRSLDQAVEAELERILQSGRETSREEAEKALSELARLAEA